MMMVIGGPSKGKDDEERPSYGKRGESEDSEGGSMLSGMTRKRASKDILRAIEEGDVSALDKALAAHYAACSGDDEE